MDVDEEVAFIGQRSGETLQWRHNGRNVEGHKIEGKIHGTTPKPDETWLNYSLVN